MVSVRVALALALISTGFRAAAQDASVVWRVENPFRYFRDSELTQAHRALYLELRNQNGGAEPSVHDMEQAFARASDGRGWVEKLVPRERYKSIAEAVRHDPCWHREDAVCDASYTAPKFHDVMVKLPARSGSLCLWSIDGVEKARQDCGIETKVLVPHPAGARVTAAIDGAPGGGTDIKVRDYLIIGMGDSFSSGEGNPDRPVTFDAKRVINYDSNPTRPSPWLTGFPARAGTYQKTSDPEFGELSAQWLHRPCHRSSYSQQLRAALFLAIRGNEQHHAVTFVHLACTGAEVVNGLFYTGKGNEKTAESASVVQLGQLAGAARAICGETVPEPVANAVTLQNPDLASPQKTLQPTILKCPRDKTRPIDLLLLSVGGNDVGFAGLVARATLRLDFVTKNLLDMVKRNPQLSVQQSARLLPVLTHNYGALATAFRDVLHVTEAKRIVLTAYPVMSTAARGKTCPSSKRGMESSLYFQFARAQGEATERFAARDLTPAMQRAAEEHNWTWVSEHRSRFEDHGFCAVSTTDTDPGSRSLDMPRRFRRGEDFATANARSGFGGERGTVGRNIPWRPTGYSPDRWKPYWPRARWVRTPNDAFLTTNLHESDKVINESTLTRYMAYSGAFHPTAEGHAITASAVIERINLLKLVE